MPRELRSARGSRLEADFDIEERATGLCTSIIPQLKYGGKLYGVDKPFLLCYLTNSVALA